MSSALTRRWFEIPDLAYRRQPTIDESIPARTGEERARAYAHNMVWLRGLRIQIARLAWQDYIDALDQIRDAPWWVPGGDCGCPLHGDGDCRAPTGPRRAGCLARPA